MPWFKVDDKLHDHRKARVAQKAAIGVWTLAGSWSSDNLTDGFVPESVLMRWGTKADARRLVEAGLWYVDQQDGEKGWRFHQWAERNPLREEKLREREAKAEAGRRGGKASGQARAKQSASPSASSVVEADANTRTRTRTRDSVDGSESSSSNESNARALRVVNGGYLHTEAGDA